MDNIPAAGASAGANEAEVVDHQTAITELFAQMDVIDERIARNQSETERLRAETWVMLDQMQTDQSGARGQAPPPRDL